MRSRGRNERESKALQLSWTWPNVWGTGFSLSSPKPQPLQTVHCVLFLSFHHFSLWPFSPPSTVSNRARKGTSIWKEQVLAANGCMYLEQTAGSGPWNECPPILESWDRNPLHYFSKHLPRPHCQGTLEWAFAEHTEEGTGLGSLALLQHCRCLCNPEEVFFPPGPILNSLAHCRLPEVFHAWKNGEP